MVTAVLTLLHKYFELQSRQHVFFSAPVQACCLPAARLCFLQSAFLWTRGRKTKREAARAHIKFLPCPLSFSYARRPMGLFLSERKMHNPRFKTKAEPYRGPTVFVELGLCVCLWCVCVCVCVHWRFTFPVESNRAIFVM